MRTAKTSFITLITLIVVVFAICYGFLKSEGLNARKKPSNFEYAIASRALALSIPTDAQDAKNPIRPAPDVFAEAGKYYSDSCAVCHANDGTGKTPTGKGLSPEVPDLHAQHVQKLTDGEMFYIIKNGVRFTGMPGWDLPDGRVWQLVLLIRQFANEKTSRQ